MKDSRSPYREKEVYLSIPSPSILASPFRIPPSSERIAPKTPKTPSKPNVFYYDAGSSDEEEEGGSIDTYGSFFPNLYSQKAKENNDRSRVDEAAEKLKEWDQRRNQEANQLSRTIDEELTRKMEDVRIDVMQDYLNYSKEKKKENNTKNSHQSTIQKTMEAIKSAQLKEYEEKRKLIEDFEKKEEEKQRIKEEKEKEIAREKEKKELEAKSKVEAAQKAKEEEEKKKKQEAATEEAKKTLVNPPISTEKPTIPSPSIQPSNSNADPNYLPLSASEIYERRIALANEITAKAKLVEADSNLKREIFPKVNVPVSQISNTMEQVTKKSQQLLQLLNSLRSKPECYAYAQHLLFTKINEQASVQVSAHITSCFGFGAALSYVVSLSPDILDSLLGYFHLACPYTLPNYVKKSKDMTEAEHKDALGFKKRALDGAYEPEDTYTNRMGGILAVYTAFMCCNENVGVKSNYGIENCWTWLARLLNMPPQKITATLLTVFLKVAGHKMHRAYGKQFKKLMSTIQKDMLPMLEEGPSKTRLTLFCQDFEKAGQIKPLDGWDLR
eukprot:TRINITY_DN4208_c0_g1_i2.p1 TRINITY_DN4208_c0_g1~~TRINITY_DN4208_c0_g1_i2.p1  ORF type:complete len:581 (-),score=226.63 TRINITY_DN4208_c0_g1_i2:31-1698(-)